MNDTTVLLGLHFSVVWNAELSEIHVMVTGPKRSFGLPGVNLVSVDVPTSKTVPSPLLPPDVAEEPHPLLYIFFKPSAL